MMPKYADFPGSRRTVLSLMPNAPTAFWSVVERSFPDFFSIWTYGYPWSQQLLAEWLVNANSSTTDPMPPPTPQPDTRSEVVAHRVVFVLARPVVASARLPLSRATIGSTINSRFNMVTSPSCSHPQRRNSELGDQGTQTGDTIDARAEDPGRVGPEVPNRGYGRSC